jgi:hypothetical protein
MMKRIPAAVVLVFLLAMSVSAGEADVVSVEVMTSKDGTQRFEVTVRHADEGWEHFANRWEVLAPDGKVLATRVLYHPHVDEQPFTRGLGGVKLPEGVGEITIRAHDSVHGYGGREVTATLEL